MTYSGAEQSGTSYTIKTLHKISWERHHGTALQSLYPCWQHWRNRPHVRLSYLIKVLLQLQWCHHANIFTGLQMNTWTDWLTVKLPLNCIFSWTFLNYLELYSICFELHNHSAHSYRPMVLGRNISTSQSDFLRLVHTDCYMQSINLSIMKPLVA